MVVGDYEGLSSLADHLAEHLGGAHQGLDAGARGELGAAQEAISAVKSQNPAFLHIEAEGAGAEVGVEILRLGEDGRRVALGGEHAAGYFHDGAKLEGLDLADAFEAKEIAVLPAGEGVK